MTVVLRSYNVGTQKICESHDPNDDKQDRAWESVSLKLFLIETPKSF